MDKIDQLIHAKWIVTCEDNNQVLEDHCIAVKDGKIHAIIPGKDAEAKYECTATSTFSSHAKDVHRNQTKKYHFSFSFFSFSSHAKDVHRNQTKISFFRFLCRRAVWDTSFAFVFLVGVVELQSVSVTDS